MSQQVRCPQCKIKVDIDDILHNENDPFLHRENGGCVSCSQKCNKCKRVISLEEAHLVNEDGKSLIICEYCLKDDYLPCEICQIYLKKDKLTLAELKGENDEDYIEGKGYYICQKCLDKHYKICEQCKKPVENELATNFFENFYHETCIPDEQPQLLDFSSIDRSKFKNFSWSEQEYILDFLEKIAPISIQQIKKNYQNLYYQIQDLIKENNGKDFTADFIKLKKKELKPRVFEIDYSSWFSTQRSYIQDEPQIILKIQKDQNISSIIDNDPYYKLLFDNIKNFNNERGHPIIDNHLGWARLEINNIEKYILVDEIQTDFPIICSKIISSINSELNNNDNKNTSLSSLNFKYSDIISGLVRLFIINNIDDKKHIKEIYFSLPNEKIKEILLFIINKIESFKKIFNNFPNIAIIAIEKFAKANHFNKIYYPTLGTLIELRGHKNDDGTPSKKLPSKEIYENLPKKHFYENKGNYPFNFKTLEFYEKNASINKISNLFLKRINKL